MGRLVDVDKVIKAVDKHTKDCLEIVLDNDITCILEEVPTAFDVDKVVEQLEVAKEKIAKEDYCRTKHYIENDCEHKDCFVCCAEYLINIVKAGGVNESN